MAELVFYTHPRSRGRVVRWMLEEVGEPYRTEIIEFGPPMKSAAYTSVNPMGKVPALRHGDQVVTETAAICAYLADAFPAAGLAPPPGDPSRAPYYRWLFFAAGALEPAVMNQAAGFVAEDKHRAMLGYGCMEDCVATLDAALAGREHLAGDRFTAADLFVSSTLGFGMMFGTIPRRPGFEQFVARHRNRPAFARAQEVDGPMNPGG